MEPSLQRIRNFFEQLHPLNDNEWALLEQHFYREEFTKRTFLLEAGKVGNYVAFVESGLYRFYHIRDGVERVTAFFFPGDFVSNYRSFITNEPSDHFIECLEDGAVWKLKRNDLQALFLQNQIMERLGRLMAERLYIMVAKRLDSFQSETPEERYLALIKKGSRLIQDLPQYMLASYLGISPESLSRIRKRITP